MPSENLFKSWEKPVEVLVIQTRSKGPPSSKYTNNTQALKIKITPDHSKTYFSLSKKHVHIHTQESPKLDYNIVEDLKKLKASISVMDICRIPQQKDFLLQALNSVEKMTAGNGPERNLSPIDLVGKPTVNTCLGDRKENPFVPSFLLTFEIFNRNLHNYLVDSGASSNIIPLSIFKTLNSIPLKSDKHVIQLDRTQVKVIGELRDVMIRISTHPTFMQLIDIIVVDIPEAYGLLLSRDWSEKIKGYFSTDWAHLCLPLKGYKNMIRIDRYLKHTVIDLETPNELSSIDFHILGNYSCDSYFGNFAPLLSNVSLTQNSKLIFQEKLLIPTRDTLFCQDPALELAK
jgi:hypothetical protein